MFHPPETIVWHEYTRQNRRKHWDDHVSVNGVVHEWHMRDQKSKQKIKRFMATTSVGTFECGTARTLQDYENYAGLNFRHRRAQDCTIRGAEPPNPSCAPDWAERTRTWQIRIELDRTALPHAAVTDPYFWYVGFHDHHGQEVYRRDISEPDFSSILGSGTSKVIIDRQFESMREPTNWTVWPYSHSKGWLGKITGIVSGASSRT